ncbi:hypothetical protein LX97_00562 [Nonlabens dokdonensis]|jgi:hypothetical protein|uniref:Uncharacterized protein n=1 Tax=Nonlabens dokdonensis TaxID=328515 RepID=A0ABX5Q0T0_9FLAO|nr:hypothetical protein [Nonlabens dokdonensis]PZX43561.1 hypothetical protein LX97_00562 [Nonlabens dokdonensis]
MKPNTFNICPTCIFRNTCVLTTQKNQVWSCSEYQEGKAEKQVKPIKTKLKKAQPEMAMA